MQAPGFWDDQDAAAKIRAEHARTSRRLDEFATLERDVEDLVELGRGPGARRRARRQLAAVEARLAELEEQRLFAGELRRAATRS